MLQTELMMELEAKIKGQSKVQMDGNVVIVEVIKRVRYGGRK